MIGLKRKTVRVVDHDPAWIDLGVEACHRLRDAGGDLVSDVQHVGSTAVSSLPAKPILDLVVAVRSLEVMLALTTRLRALGYLYRGDGKGKGGHLFVRESEPDVRTAHLHVVAIDDVQWRDYLRFRDSLRGDPELRQRYAELKRDLARRFPADRESYTESKDEFVRAVLEERPGRVPVRKR